MSDRKTVVIVGAGLSGLVCGMRLSKAGFDVSIIEELTYPGGLLASSRMGKEYIELLPHHLRKTDKALLSLIKEEGLSDEIEWFDSLWYGKASRTKVGYFKKGFQSLISILIQDITDNGGRIYYSTTVSEINKISDEEGTEKYSVSLVLPTSASSEIISDYVIYTGSCRSFVNVSHGLPMSMNVRDQLMNISYKSVLCLLLVLKKKHSEVFFQHFNSNEPFDRSVNHTNITGERGYGGNVVYLVGHCNVSDNIWVQSDSEIQSTYFAAFHKTYPLIKKSDIKSWRLTKVRYAVSEKYPDTDLSSPLPNLFVCSSGLTSTTSKFDPENRMDKIVSLSNDISQRIINDTKEKTVNE